MKHRAVERFPPVIVLGRHFVKPLQRCRAHALLFGSFYRRKRPQFAQVATAHKIARTFYSLLKRHMQYVDMGADSYDQQQREREVAVLRKKAARLGLTLTTPESAQAVA